MAEDNPDHSRPPHRYQSLIQLRLTSLSTAEQAVAEHLAAHPEQVPFETAASLAKRLGVSAMTVGRTLKALGYRGLGELRSEMRSEVPDPTSAPWAQQGPAARAHVPKSRERARALRAELEAVQSVHALAESEMWQGAVGAIASADKVFVTGFQTERGLALVFADQLAYVRTGVRYLSVENRGFADLRTEAGPGSCLVMVDARRYSRWFRLLAEKAAALNVPLVLATDAYCRWASDLTPYVLSVRTDAGRFWDSTAPISSLLSLLVEDVIERLGDSVYAQLDAASEFQAAFVGFDRVHRQRRGQDGHKMRPPRSSGKSRKKRTPAKH